MQFEQIVLNNFFFYDNVELNSNCWQNKVLRYKRSVIIYLTTLAYKQLCNEYVKSKITYTSKLKMQSCIKISDYF